MFEQQDLLAALDESLPLGRKLEALHTRLRRDHPFVDRIAVASFEPKTSMLRTFLSSGGDLPLVRYEAPLDNAPSLREILTTGRPRVVNDLALFASGPHEHTQAIHRQGYGSSYTRPIRMNGQCWGFLFFNSYETGPFTPAVLDSLDVYGHLISSLVTSEILAVRTLGAAVRTAHEMVHLRDPETGGHLDRMAEFSRIIARDLAAEGKRAFDDEYIERIYLYAPLHDLGKIGIPDRVLLKAGKLTEAETEMMRTHSRKGVEMIDQMIENFGLRHFESIDVLRNIAQYHHEAMDGSGYPMGLRGEAVPIEARIIAVADVFDALTSRRPYKTPWSNDAAFSMLRRLAGTQLDRDCVEALERNGERVKQIQDRYSGAAG
jgi:HD-GYP domain-containing protein (c-di-GMP phosphodiesterase class II)